MDPLANPLIKGVRPFIGGGVSAPLETVDSAPLASTIEPLASSIAAPTATFPALGTSLVRSPASPTQTQMDMTERNRLINSGDGISQIHSKPGRVAARVADITASVFAPNIAMAIPGTTLHHNMLVNQAERNVQRDQEQEKNVADIAGQQATTRHINDEANAMEALKAPQYEYIDTPNGKVAVLKGTTTATPLTVDGKPIVAPVKSPTNPFELWLSKNPNGTIEDFNKIQAKPLTKEQAASLNAVWDGLADKHHLPRGQFTEGMAGADATQLQTALNNAVGKQQGDTRVTVSLQGLQNQRARNAPLDAADPAMQASVEAVANGSLKLSDVFGRGATTAQKAQFAAAVKAVNPNYNSGDHDIENSARRYMISGQGGQTLNAINTAYNHLDHLDAAAKAVNGGDVKALNKFANELGVQVQNGASPQVVFDLVKTALKGEMARAFTGAGATVDEQHALDVSFGNANSLPTLLAVAHESRGLLKGKEKSLQGQYEAGKKGQANFGALDGGNSSEKVDGHWDPVTKKVVYH